MLTLTVKIDSESYVLQISPWAEIINFEDLEMQITKVDTNHLPDGPVRRLEFLKEDKTYIIVGSKTREHTHILPEWQISTGDVIEKRTDNRFWVNVVLSSSNQKIVAEPGKAVNITSNDEQWTFLLIGASVPERDAIAEQKVDPEEIADSNESMFITDTGEISDEEPGLTVDWILYKHE